MIDSSSVVGIDVSKDSLDVAFGLEGGVRRFANRPGGHRALARTLAGRAPHASSWRRPAGTSGRCSGT